MAGFALSTEAMRQLLSHKRQIADIDETITVHFGASIVTRLIGPLPERRSNGKSIVTIDKPITIYIAGNGQGFSN